MKLAQDWTDYEVIATSDGEKLERWGKIFLLRPDPQVIWNNKESLANHPALHAHYTRSSTGGGMWQTLKSMPEEWTVSWRNLNFRVKPMGFKHTGLFPEQAVNWAEMISLIQGAKRPISVLNLFAYTGGATVACASAGASVTHVDAAKGMVERAKENAALSKLKDAPIRYIIDDCKKFVEKEIRRGKRYDAIIMDPPSYGRGPTGEMWKIEEHLFDFVMLCKQVLSEQPLFVLINSYTTGLQPAVLHNILSVTFGSASVTAYEVCLPVSKHDIVLPCGASGLKTWR